MAKVIVERPRCGGGVKFPRSSVRSANRMAPEDWQCRQSMKRPWELASCKKYLNENLAPLRRFLRSHVGRQWDEVYAEVCQRINRDSAVQLHIWQHLMQYVCTDPHIVRGEVGSRGRGLASYRFFVHPRTGRLCVNDDAWCRRCRKNPKCEPRLPGRQTITDKGRHYRQIESAWHEVKFAPLPKNLDGLYDALLDTSGKELTRDLLARLYPANVYHQDVYCYAKRQLDARESRRLQAILDERAREEAVRRQQRPEAIRG
jgi:hypothetical protein